MYLNLIRPIVVLYGVEAKPLRKAEEQKMAVFERTVLRKIYVLYFGAHIGKKKIDFGGIRLAKHGLIIKKKVIEEDSQGCSIGVDNSPSLKFSMLILSNLDFSDLKTFFFAKYFFSYV